MTIYANCSGKQKEQERSEKLTYMQAHGDAERRLAVGERQLFCPSCRLFYWEEYRADHTEGELVP